MKITNNKKSQQEIQKEIEDMMMEKHGRIYKVKKKYRLYDEFGSELYAYCVVYHKGELKIYVDKTKKEIRKNKLNELKNIL